MKIKDFAVLFLNQIVRKQELIIAFQILNFSTFVTFEEIFLNQSLSSVVSEIVQLLRVAVNGNEMYSCI